MPSSPDLSAAVWYRRRYSYAAVLALAGLGLIFPRHAGWLLGPPLAVGMVVLGIAHGACDQLVVPASPTGRGPRSGWQYWLRFLLGYLGLAGVVGVLWWRWPAATVALFFLLTIWHWGSADAPETPRIPRGVWLAHSLLRGLLLFVLPGWWWPAATAAVVNGLLTFTGAAPMAPAPAATGMAGLGLVVVAGHGALWLWYAAGRQWQLLQTDVADVLVLLLVLAALPPQLSVGVYFVFWHSLQHVLRLTGWLGYAPTNGHPPGGPALLARLAFFLRRAAPLLLLSCVALLVLAWLVAPRVPNAAAWFSLALVAASVVTLPHALLVTLVMDARHWQTPDRQQP